MHIPQIQHTAAGSGLYTVYLDGVAQTPEHITTREADEHSTNLKLANPNSVVTYTQNLVVTTTLSYLADPEPAPPPSADLIFSDDFNYVVERDVAGAAAIFQSHGWAGAKTVQDGFSGARGYVYTVDSIPGAGSMPAGTRALCMEALPATLGGQTDFYLEYGGETPEFENAIPANVWLKFWLYINHVPGQLSQMDENKFIYACSAGYPCHDYRWMLSLSTNSADPMWNVVDGSQGDCYLNLSANPTYSDDTVTNTNTTNPGYEWRMGQNNITERIRPNRWQEITIHLDTSTNNGIYEAWIHPLGGTKVKVAEYISGVNGFQWTIPVPSGHRIFRMPTTVGRANGSGYDQWVYMQNLRIATTEPV